MGPIASENDIIHNKINVLLAQNQRFVASWPSLRRALTSPQQPPDTRSEEEGMREEEQREEHEVFTPMPEILALGAKIPKDGEVKREELSSNEKLRRQLLGKDYAKSQGNSARCEEESMQGSSSFGSKPRPTSTKREAESDSDEGGRSSLVKSRQGRKQNQVRSDNEFNEGVEFAKSEEAPKNASSYLDEVLADRKLQSQRRSEKKRKKGSN